MELTFEEKLPAQAQTPGDLRLRVDVRFGEARGRYDAVWIAEPEARRFLDELRTLGADGAGVARLESMSPGEFALEFESEGAAGLAVLVRLERLGPAGDVSLAGRCELTRLQTVDLASDFEALFAEPMASDARERCVELGSRLGLPPVVRGLGALAVLLWGWFIFAQFRTQQFGVSLTALLTVLVFVLPVAWVPFAGLRWRVLGWGVAAMVLTVIGPVEASAAWEERGFLARTRSLPAEAAIVLQARCWPFAHHHLWFDPASGRHGAGC